jgi:predicted glycosyltransferase
MPYFCFVKVGQHSFERKKKRGVILVAPLNWGLGHATRCIPIIKKLLKLGFEVVIARSGYTTVMDLAKTQTPAFFIPTPGRYEQESLAQRLSANLIAPYSDQGSFDLILLKQLKSYDGWPTSGHREKLKSLFGIFERK